MDTTTPAPVTTAPPDPAVVFHEHVRRGGAVRLRVRLPVRDDAPAQALRAVVLSRQTRMRHEVPGTLAAPTRARRGGGRVQEGEVTLDLAALVGRLAPADEMLDVLVATDDARGTTTLRRVRRPLGARARPWGVVTRGDEVVQLVPYTTFRAGHRSLLVERMTPEALAALHRWRRVAWLLPPVRAVRGTWLVGEQPHRAQDNGYHLFRWLREHRPDLPAYYVIDATSPDLPRLEGLGHVVLRHSPEHVRVAFLATRLVGTHHAEYLLPSRDPRVVRAVRGVRVFIRHGVSGTKNMVGNYGRFAPGFRTDRLHVSSDRERDTAVREFRYRPAQVRVTGLPRFDALLRPPERPPSGVLVVPTWREWISNHEAFIASEYRQAWQAVLGHPALADAVAGGLRVTFILHPNMRGFAEAFAAPGVRVLTQGEAELQTLLREHEMLVTDYSSVGFDVALLGRPVAYFQFDQERFFGAQGSHLDLNADLPGPIVRDVDALVEHVLDTARRGYPVAPGYADRAHRLVRYHDRRNCERVAHSVATAGGPAVQWWRLVDRGAAGLRATARRVRARVRAATT
ncbi:CDP-glycerol glycerophosphotransferase family protein [Phycicoccus sp. BSK3Z-2]|uniref:CDP-glycerol glycerophosphotransferase family protein n=1 Tax=Phycicoccus avicenniae TaxID=2828860 RepID=A0A941I0W3_9MICO|nr:CDP-glycerol glycerophosphotransferase family protein [Phycicoccus avicenniae]MBR7743479.1 CDP-glycerol glycerophosphotransferase family protein [Phycicoccus avicenniae]